MTVYLIVFELSEPEHLGLLKKTLNTYCINSMPLFEESAWLVTFPGSGITLMTHLENNLRGLIDKVLTVKINGSAFIQGGRLLMEEYKRFLASNH